MRRAVGGGVMADFDFHGISVRLEVDDETVSERLCGDFQFFRSSSLVPRMSFKVVVGRPPPTPGRPSLRRPGYRAFDRGTRRFIDYLGEACATWDYERLEGLIVGATPELAREAAHLAVLSRVGEALDRRGLHRVHALGVSLGDRAALLLLESGGGKSVLAMEALRGTALQLLSDDTPLIDAQGGVLPFPLRIGLLSQDDTRGVPGGCLGEFPRRGRPTKTTVSLEFFARRISKPASAVALLLGRRRPGPPLPARQALRPRALGALLDSMVVGRGVAQMSEYVLRAEKGHLRAWAGIAAARLRAALSVSWRVPAHDFFLSGDASADARRLERFLKETPDS